MCQTDCQMVLYYSMGLSLPKVFLVLMLIIILLLEFWSIFLQSQDWKSKKKDLETKKVESYIFQAK